MLNIDILLASWNQKSSSNFDGPTSREFPCFCCDSRMLSTPLYGHSVCVMRKVRSMWLILECGGKQDILIDGEGFGALSAFPLSAYPPLPL